jgi:hypothetical protein
MGKDFTSFAEHEAAQLERWRKLSPQERLRWLDQAKDFAAKAAEARAAGAARKSDGK